MSVADREPDADRVSDALEARPCSAEDLAPLRATWPLSADVHDRHFTGQLSGTQTLLVAWMHGQAGDEAVGSVVIRWQSSELGEFGNTYPGVVVIAHLQVRPDRRRQGVGTCLMQVAENMARRHEVPWLALGVGVENPAAAALYERLGYTRTGIVMRSEYQYFDETGVEQHAAEWDDYLIRNLEVTH